MIKGALHIHSNIPSDIPTDSAVSLEYAKELFKKKGFSFMLLTEHAEHLDEQRYQEHKERCQKLCDENFLIIPGLEVKWKDLVHFLAYDAVHYMENEKSLSIQDTIAKIRKVTQCRFLVWGHINNPLKVTRDFLPVLEEVDGIEAFNTTYNKIFPDGKGLLYLNYLARRSKKILAFGGLDMHEANNHSKIACLITKECPIEKNSILDAIASGQYILRGRLIRLIPQGEYSLFLIWGSIAINALIDVVMRVKIKCYSLFKRQFIEDRKLEHGID